MKARTLAIFIGLALISICYMGCSFSASASVGTDQRHTLDGADKIIVKAKQPPAPVRNKPVKVEKPKPMAVIVDKKIEINQKVMFDYNKASIKVESNELLASVAKVMVDNPKVTKVRVEGHTDGDGSEKYNKKLSQERADSVKDFLVKAGVAEDRLESVGYGEERPIAENDTEEGKEKNRRVEFNIIAEAKKNKKK